MSVRMRRHPSAKAGSKGIIVVSTAVHVEEYVDVDAEIDVDEFVKGLKPEDRAELMKALMAGDRGAAFDGGIHPQDAYYAMARGDIDMVRRFVCECAGRIA
jgi:hypothetical protein